jgi:hypothetical protein
MVLWPDARVSLCFYFPERFSIPVVDPNAKPLAELRARYALDGEMFEDRCIRCLQAGLSARLRQNQSC